MKRTLLALLFIVSTITVNAQSLNLTWGPEISNTDLISKYGLNLGFIKTTSADGTYWLKANVTKGGLFNMKQVIKLAKFSPDDNLISNTEPIINTDDEKQKIKLKEERTFTLGGRLVIGYSYYNSDQDINYGFINYLDDKTYTQGKPNIVDQIPATKRRNKGDFNFVSSRDENLVALFRNNPYDKNANESFTITLIDKNLNKVWQRDETINASDKFLTLGGTLCGNDGTVYVLMKYHESNGKLFKKDDAPTRWFVYAYGDPIKNPKPNIFEIELPNRTINEIDIVNNKNNDIVCVGTYGNKEEKKPLIGAYAITIDANTKKVKKTAIKPFTESFLISISGGKKKVRKGGLSNFLTLGVLEKEDGSINFVMEQQYLVIVTTRNQNGGSTTTYYYYRNGIIVFDVDKNGIINYVSEIQKKQVQTNRFEDIGAGVMTFGDKTYLLYLDNKKNVDQNALREIAYKPGLNQKAVMMLATVDSKGNVSKQVIGDIKSNGGFYIKPAISQQINPTTVKVFARKGKIIKIGTIKMGS